MIAQWTSKFPLISLFMLFCLVPLLVQFFSVKTIHILCCRSYTNSFNSLFVLFFIRQQIRFVWKFKQTPFRTQWKSTVFYYIRFAFDRYVNIFMGPVSGPFHLFQLGKILIYWIAVPSNTVYSVRQCLLNVQFSILIRPIVERICMFWSFSSLCTTLEYIDPIYHWLIFTRICQISKVSKQILFVYDKLAHFFRLHLFTEAIWWWINHFYHVGNFMNSYPLTSSQLMNIQ